MSSPAPTSTVPKDPSPRDDEPEEAAGAAVVAAGAAVVATAEELLEELLSSLPQLELTSAKAKQAPSTARILRFTIFSSPALTKNRQATQIARN